MVTVDQFFSLNFASLLNKNGLQNEAIIFSAFRIHQYECNGTN